MITLPNFQFERSAFYCFRRSMALMCFCLPCTCMNTETSVPTQIGVEFTSRTLTLSGISPQHNTEQPFTSQSLSSIFGLLKCVVSILHTFGVALQRKGMNTSFTVTPSIN